jgi:SAM-dependent methyltransferase
MLNPHFDENLVVWSDEYSGRYNPPPTGYGEQFDLQWKRAIEGDKHYFEYPGASTDDEYIEDRVYQWTGTHPSSRGFMDDRGVRVLDVPLNPDLIKGKRCIDIGCGIGRWTKTMQFIGANEVVSLDLSESAIKSVSQFNDKVLRTNIMNIPDEHPELVGQFDFANFWGVAMCTHDPQEAFMSAASTVKPGGAMFLMVYAPEGMHNTPLVVKQRKTFHTLQTVEERLAYVDHIYNRKWDTSFPLSQNIRNIVRNTLSRQRMTKVGILDMLEPFYNWVIPWDVIQNWYKTAGFTDVSLLNQLESPKCAFHVLGKKEK